MTVGVQVYNTIIRVWGMSFPMEAEEAFKRLQLSGLQPDEETFIALINGWAGSNAVMRQ